MCIHRSITRRITCLFLSIMLWNTTYCQRTHIVEYLGFAEGLPSLNINGVAQDSQGLIWFAAFGTGLIRYDGSKFKIFNHSIESKPRLTSNHLRDIIVDKKGYLWIANNAGIDIVDPKSLKLIKFIPLAGNDAMFTCCCDYFLINLLNQSSLQ